MPTYRVYLLKNNRLTRWEDIQAPHDLAAIDTAREFQGEHHVELWFGQRKITTFEASETADCFLLTEEA
jgi:hypothetical protein